MHEVVASGRLENLVSKTGLVEIRGKGSWSPDYADAHFAELEGVLVELRGRFGRARVLVNLQQAAVQPPETAHRIAYWTGRIYRPEDRVAVLVDTLALQQQMRSTVTIATFDVFISEVAARLWLFEA